MLLVCSRLSFRGDGTESQLSWQTQLFLYLLFVCKEKGENKHEKCYITTRSPTRPNTTTSITFSSVLHRAHRAKGASCARCIHTKCMYHLITPGEGHTQFMQRTYQCCLYVLTCSIKATMHMKRSLPTLCVCTR